MRPRVLAVLVVIGGATRAAAENVVVELGTGAVTATTPFTAPTCPARTDGHAAYDQDRDSLRVHVGRRVVRHRLRVDGEGLVWNAEADGMLVIGTQLHRATTFESDHVFAIDLRTGKRRWDRALASRGVGNLGSDRLVVEAGAELIVLEPRTGREITRVASSIGIMHVCRSAGGLDLVKTTASLHAFDPTTGGLAWSVPASFDAAPAAAGGSVVDVTFDVPHHRWGIAVYRATDGTPVRSIDVGELGPPDIIEFGLEARGADRVAIHASFALE